MNIEEILLKYKSITSANLCDEYLRLKVYDPTCDYTLILKSYLRYRDYYDPGFRRRTNHLCEMDIFRRCIREYIKEYIPRCLSKKDDEFLYLSSDGVFNTNKKSVEDEKDKEFMNLCCLIELNRFWEKMMSLQTPDVPNLPVYIKCGSEELKKRVSKLYSGKTDFKIEFFDNVQNLVHN